MKAYVDGATAPLETATAAAARLLDEARLPLVAGLATDVDGARAAISSRREIARRLRSRGIAKSLLRDIDVLRQAGRIRRRPRTMCARRADHVLLIGPTISPRSGRISPSGFTLTSPARLRATISEPAKFSGSAGQQAMPRASARPKLRRPLGNCRSLSPPCAQQSPAAKPARAARSAQNRRSLRRDLEGGAFRRGGLVG